MSGLFCSSIGRKLLMSLSGLFLITFLLVHLSINALLLVPDGGRLFNAGAHFMATNPAIKIMEPILGLGFLVHIIYGVILTIQNRKARGNDRYDSGNNTHSVSWASQNMLVLGITVFAFLVVHLANFWVKMKITGEGGSIIRPLFIALHNSKPSISGRFISNRNKSGFFDSRAARQSSAFSNKSSSQSGAKIMEIMSRTSGSSSTTKTLKHEVIC